MEQSTNRVTDGQSDEVDCSNGADSVADSPPPCKRAKHSDCTDSESSSSSDLEDEEYSSPVAAPGSTDSGRELCSRMAIGESRQDGHSLEPSPSPSHSSSTSFTTS